jgi:hypothetical protein
MISVTMKLLLLCVLILVSGEVCTPRSDSSDGEMLGIVHLQKFSAQRFSKRSATEASSATPPRERQGERVPAAAVINGVPQGMFVGRSLLTGRAVCLLFLSGGRVTRAIPTGGLDAFNWARHLAGHAGDSGAWQLAGGELQITWGDGGIQRGMLNELPSGIEFYGKRYARPASVSVAELAGRWESARGTAVVGGEGINVASTLVIQDDGRYRWTGAMGGVVSGRAAASEGKARAGTIEISGATIVFRADDGTVTSHTFLPVAGTPLVAFSIDSDLFSRVE